jgi:hypothetical protein
MPRVVTLSEALREIKLVEAGGITGTAANMRVMLWKPQDKAYPKGVWVQVPVLVLDLRKHLRKGYLHEKPDDVDEPFSIAPVSGETIAEAEKRIGTMTAPLTTTGAVNNAGVAVDLGDLSTKTKPILVSIAKGFGLALDMKMKKDEMIIALEGKNVAP